MSKHPSANALAGGTRLDDGIPPAAASRRRFAAYRRRVREGALPAGSPHGSAAARTDARRTRTTRQLLAAFYGLLRPVRGELAAVLGSLTLATLLGLLPPVGTKLVVDYALTGQPLPSWAAERFAWLSSPSRILGATVTAVCVVALVRLLIHLWGRWHATRITKQIQLGLRRRVFEHAVRLPLHRVHELRSGGAASILREDGGSVGELVFGLLFNPWRALIQLLGSLVALAWVDWTLLLGAGILLPLVYLSHRTWINRIRPQFRAIRKQREAIDADAAETFAGMRVVRAFSRQRRESVRFSTENNLMARQELYAWWWMRTVETAWEALIPLSTAALLYFGGRGVLQGHLTVGDLMMFLVYLVMLLEPLAILAQSATQIQNSLSGLDRVLDLLGEPREMPSSPQSLLADRRTVEGRIALENVTFAYPGAEAPALIDVSLAAAAGQSVALVGPSGAGKTTLSNLVARFYDPDAGRLTLDGRDLRDYDVESFRGLLGIVEQDVFLFDGTIAENIAYARRDATAAEVRAAADAAHASEFIDRLPQGMQSVIGERGVKLSGGQRQRLAIARAILADPRLLILDEATSNLDTESERLIQQSLSALMRGRTSFVIAHRLSTIAGADLIVVLDQGRILETGTHGQLMARSSRYRSMVEQQVRMTLGDAAPAGPAAPQASSGLPWPAALPTESP